MRIEEVMLGPFEPKFPCRHMETRPCVLIPNIKPEEATKEMMNNWFRGSVCPPKLCGRHPDRDKHE